MRRLQAAVCGEERICPSAGIFYLTPSCSLEVKLARVEPLQGLAAETTSTHHMGHAILTNVKHVLVSRDEEGKIFVSEVWGLPEKARRVLQAAAVEAYGRTGTYVTMTPVMNRANISDLEEFWSIAQYLEGKGWIAEADPDYGVFVLTNEGIDEATM
ncbi:MAG: hypothetical protein QOI57_3413 [Rubrobacteraceae bacterium]|jgi:hypothetical protein|nr:hypothetical protein [Rubrobacteraceae bacterium]